MTGPRRPYDLTPPPGAQVREAALEAASEPRPEAFIPPGTTTAPGASNKQLSFLRDLVNQREIEPAAAAALLERINTQSEINADHGDCSPPLATNGLTKKRATEFIERLLTKPKRPKGERGATTDPSLPGPDVLPAGRYAIKQESSGELRFYHLWRGDRNPNYVKLYVEQGPNQTEIPFKSHEFKGIINRIAEDPAAAARLYGRHIGACSQCYKRLTNRISRLLDIGPICGGHFYDEEIWKALKARARQALLDAGLDPDQDVEDTDDLDRIRGLAGL